MKKLRFSCRTIILISILMFSVSMAAVATPIVVPDSLAVGDQYRLAFLTTDTIDATSSDISTYNDFVTSQATAQTELNDLGTTWKAIVSTLQDDARDNTGTNPSATGVPIFLLNNTILADNNADLWDGSIDTPLQIGSANLMQIGREGSELGGGVFVVVWTGSSIDGTASREFGEFGDETLWNLVMKH